MKIKETSFGVELSEVNEFSLKETFECGQCFRWKEIEQKRFYGVAFGRSIIISERPTVITLENISIKEFNDIWKNYFDLDTDYLKIKSELSKIHPVLQEASQYSTGIRILKQDPWETLCSFIISQNNNIPRISGIISRLCENFGNKIGESSFAFPEAEVIAKLREEDLGVLRSGFRAKYILDAANKVASSEVDLAKINQMSISDARSSLMKICGVGPKVADCTLLYGFHKLNAFPVDVWIKKAMKILFKEMTIEDFGIYAGVAQQYIFHYSRMNKELFKNDS